MSRLELECQYEYYLRSIGRSCWDEKTYDMKCKTCNFEPRALSDSEKKAAIEWQQEKGLE